MQLGSLPAGLGLGGISGVGGPQGPVGDPNDPLQQLEMLMAKLKEGGQSPKELEQLVMELLKLLKAIAAQNPELAAKLLERLMGGAPAVGQALQSAAGGAAPAAGGGAPSGFGIVDNFQRMGGAPTPAGPEAQNRVNALTQDLAGKSPLFAQMLSQFPGGVQVAQIPDPAGVDIRGTYVPGTNQLMIDVDNLNDPNIQETIAEEVAHRAISQSALQANPGLPSGAVVNQANEVIAKTYAKLMVAEANGQAITPQLMDQAIGAAFRDVAQNYGGVPRGNYGPLLDAVLRQTETGMDGILGQKLAAAFEQNGFAR